MSVLAVFKLYRGLPRTVYILFFATVINGVGIFVFPFLTLFLTKKAGMDPREAGNFMFLTAIAYLPGTIIGGKLADRYGRKVVAVTAQLLASAAFIPCGFLLLAGPEAEVRVRTIIPFFILLNIIFDGFADPARQAIQMDISTPENRQATFSLNYLGHNLGFAVGPLMAGFLFVAAPQWLFWGNALAATAAISLVAFLVPETKPSDAALRASLDTDSTEKAHQGSLWSAIKARPSLVIFSTISASYWLVYAQHRFTLPLQTEALFGSRGAAFYGSLMTMNAVLVIIFTAPMIALFKRYRPIANVSLAGLLFALGFGMLALVRSPYLFYLSTLIWTLGEIINATNAEVYVANHTPMSHRGRFTALLPLIEGLGWTFATPLGGNIIHRWGIPVLWTGAFGVALAAAGSLLVLDRWTGRK